MPKSQSHSSALQRDHQIWRLSTPFLYDLVALHTLSSPSITVQWLPGISHISGEQQPLDGYSKQHMILGSTDKDENALKIMEVVLPPKFEYSEETEKQMKKNPIKGTAVKMNVIAEYQVEGEVNRIRIMPQNPSVVALRTDSNTIEIFNQVNVPQDLPSNETVKVDSDEFYPCCELEGHSKSGWGLDWSKQNEGMLLTGADDNSICLWDIQNFVTSNVGSEGVSVKPVSTINGHQGSVNDVSWSNTESDIFASVSDDMTLCIWDKRLLEPSSNPLIQDKPSSRVIAHSDEVYSVSWSPFSSKWIATASIDKTVCIWDTRNLKSPAHKLVGHQMGVDSLCWSPSEYGVLASCGLDRRVFIWDLKRTDRSPVKPSDNPTAPDANPPDELLFIHGGHMDTVSEVQWSPNMNWLLASVDKSSSCQVWEMASAIHQEGSEDSGPRFFSSDFSSA